MPNFHCKSFRCNYCLFQKIAIFNDERQINDCQPLRLKNKICQNVKTVPPFLFLEGQMNFRNRRANETEHTYYKIYRYFNYQLYHISFIFSGA